MQAVATRYAKALLDLGKEQGSLEEIHKDMMSLEEAMANRDLQLLVKSPIIKAHKKISVFKALFGDSFNKVTSGFIELVTKKGRETILPDMTTAFIDQYNKLKEVTGVKLITASPITDAALDAIKKSLLESSSTEKAVDIVAEVNPDLIGGFILQMGDKLYDASVAHKLEQIKKKFSE